MPPGSTYANSRALVHGHSIRWSDSGGDGRPLLLINGLGANLEMWAPFRAALAGRRTIAYDAPGTGGSPAPHRVLDMETQARVAAGLLDLAGCGPVDVLGYSFGGLVAQELARYDGRVTHLVLAATSAGTTMSPADLRELSGPSLLRMPLAIGMLLTPGRYYLSPSGQRLVRFVFGDGTGGDYTTADRARAERPPSAMGYWRQVLATTGWSSRPWLAELTMPVLVVSGERDALATVTAGSYLAGRVPDGRQVVLAGCGHSFLLEESPSEAAGEIARFLDAS